MVEEEPTRRCALCGHTPETGVIQCPECGSGVFETTKVHGGDRTAPKLEETRQVPEHVELRVGMTYEEVVRLLGEPSGVNPGTEMLETGPGGTVVASEGMRSRLSHTKYCMWNRPEGRYLLTIEDGKLSDIYEKP